MNECERIADQHRRAFDGEAWHGPAVFELLGDIDARRAAARAIPAGHTIWEITLHVRTWEDAVHQRLLGRPKQVSPEEDWPPVEDPSPEAWRRALTSLRETHDALNRSIGAFDDARLQDQSPGSQGSIYELLHGAVQHALYHAGQIAVLKKC